jgi:dipeptidase D
MDKKIELLEPKGIWNNFKKLTMIPRPSKKESKAVEFVKDFGRRLGLETLADEAGNVVIRKPATPGMEERTGVVLQAHLDMVPQKNSNKIHDFENDPITAYVDGEWVKADGTTLGADNGIGVATILSLLESREIEHGPLEGLFTVDEETGMTGAFGLKQGFIRGKILLNLDSEDEGELYIGCAGGIDANIEFPYMADKITSEFIPYKITVSGLRGGHSGIDINTGRANSNKVLFRILWLAGNESGIRLCEISGGDMRNAIPREAFARIIVPSGGDGSFRKTIADLTQAIKKEFLGSEPDMKIELAADEMPERVMERQLQKDLIASVYVCPNGTIRMTDGIPGLVETSTNLAIVRSDADRINVHCLLRSSVDSAKEDLCNRFKALFGMAGANTSFTGSYPGWKPDMDSKIMKVMGGIYKKLYGKQPEIKAIHAGLECGIIGGKYSGLDMISFGPTIRHPHSPDEKVNIPSVGKFWKYLVETLKNID